MIRRFLTVCALAVAVAGCSQDATVPSAPAAKPSSADHSSVESSTNTDDSVPLEIYIDFI
ncbi:MAG: hypothetical protein H6822_18980 [Planctomycetaceae bacterium]|nr:hypothetical protein [Planctomycetales bacterium]MCB9924273.1 hypothetical protein [Planctomycetaceae bacterium]